MPDDKKNDIENNAENVINSHKDNNSTSETSEEATSEILGLLPKEDNGGHPLSDNPSQQAQASQAATPLLFPELPGLGAEWLPTTDEKILNKKHPLFLEHTKLLSEGTPVEKIEHPAKYAVWAKGQGCQCTKCKTGRNERRNKNAAGSDPLASPKAVGTFLTEKFFGRVLCLPNETMKAVCKFKHYPPEAAECWNVPNDDIKVYEDFGKFVMENYLHLEDNKHAQLAAFSLWYLGKFAITSATMNAILSKEKKK